MSFLTSSSAAPAGYDDLVALFREWRAFQRPKVVEGVADYTAPAMAAQAKGLGTMRERLEAIDPKAWPVAQRIDYEIVRAEMNGLDFDHRVRRPWARDPAFYTVLYDGETDVPAREGPKLEGAIELWSYRPPLRPEVLADLRSRLRAVPRILQQARGNLGGDARDLWLFGVHVKKGESAILADFARSAQSAHPELSPDIEAARNAVARFQAWLEAELPKKHGPSAMGRENYDWYLRHVQLVPYTWKDEERLFARELERARAELALLEHQHRALPPLVPAASAAELKRRYAEAVTEFLRFLEEREVMTAVPYMDPALREREGAFAPAAARDFFAEIEHRDSLVMRCHGTHWFDRARSRHAPHPSPIRREALLYNIFAGRAEGLATGMEEMMARAGLFEGRPRAKELVAILVANRAARGLAGLKQHSGELDAEGAMRFAAENTPNGWLRKGGETNWGEQQLYLQQPGYGTSYLTGKAQIERLLGDRARSLGADFNLRRFFDEFHAAGLIPVSLIRWEMTGDDGDLRPGRAED